MCKCTYIILYLKKYVFDIEINRLEYIYIYIYIYIYCEDGFPTKF